MEKKGNVANASAFHDPSSKDCKKLLNRMQTRALLNLDKKYCQLFLRAEQLPIKGLIDLRRKIHEIKLIFFLQKRVNVNICAYNNLHFIIGKRTIFF